MPENIQCKNCIHFKYELEIYGDSPSGEEYGICFVTYEGTKDSEKCGNHKVKKKRNANTKS